MNVINLNILECFAKYLSIYNILMNMSRGFFNFPKKIFNLMLLFGGLVGGIEKTGRVRYRYGFPAAEETRHWGRDTGQTPRAYSSFFSAEDCAQNL